jgi:deferrochelatase/peroxidase EfeB
MTSGTNSLPLEDIQGIILRGYNLAAVRHFILRILAGDAGRQLLGRLTSPADPQVSNAADWGPVAPEYRLQIGCTYAGLEALGLPTTSLAGFRNFKSFCAGAVARAADNFDTEASAPANWVGRLNEPSNVHLLISLYARDLTLLEKWSKALRLLWSTAVEELSAHTGGVLPDHSIHFGYQDGISQPTIAGAPPPPAPSQPVAPAGLFLLGQPVPEWPSLQFAVPPPDVLGRNGSFAAFRILKQDVDGFEKFLKRMAQQTGRDVEWIAAKLCGRWRSGVPLMLSPSTGVPTPPIPAERLDDFSYENDPRGEGCPFASHTRRAFPRDDFIAGGKGAAFRRRIIRRGMPYGPPYDSSRPDDIERGLIGLFIGASIEEQFEFLLTEWINKGSFTGALDIDSRDPLLGANSSASSRIDIPMPQASQMELVGFDRFVTTRGSAYVFLPSLPALRFIGSL